MPTGAANGSVLTSDASGVGTWQAAGGSIDNIASESIKTSGNVGFVGGSWYDVDATYYKADLPSAGTYMIYGALHGYNSGGDREVGEIRLYDWTLGAVVTNSVRMFSKWQAPGIAFHFMATPMWLVTVAEPTSIHLQMYASNTGKFYIYADGEGYSSFGYIKLN
jgi:hypothetical protein